MTGQHDQRACQPALVSESKSIRTPIRTPHDNTVSKPLSPLGREGIWDTKLCVDGRTRIRTLDTSELGHQIDDARVRCSRCTLGAFVTCPSGKPLPGDVLHNCAHHQPRRAGAPDAKVFFQPGPAGLPMSCRTFRKFIETVHAEDKAIGMARLMRRSTPC